jgi:phosphorylcholine metabolism protein LicD
MSVLSHSAHSAPPLTKLTQLQVDILYEILDRFDRVCSNAKLDYTLSGGTALGAIRHKGLIPWDDDGDLFMFAPQFYNRSMELFTTAASNGLIIRPFVHANGIESTGWYKIYLGSHTLPNVDIFVLENAPHSNKWMHCDPLAQTYFPTDYLTHDQIKHLYRVPFGSLNLLMFSNHAPYFYRNYGSDWTHVAWDGYDHMKDEWKPARSNERNVNDYRPALPSKTKIITQI